MSYGSICCDMCSLVWNTIGGRCRKRKTEIQKNLGFSLLGYPDSNQKRQDQNLQCYHYTIPQFCVLLLALQLCFSIASAKVRSFFETTKFFADFFLKNMRFSSILHKKTQKKELLRCLFNRNSVPLQAKKSHIINKQI